MGRARAQEAPSIDDLVRVVLEVAPVLNRGTVKRAWAVAPNQTGVLFSNPAMEATNARWLVEAALKQMWRSPDGGYLYAETGWQTMRAAYLAGFLDAADPATDSLIRLFHSGTGPNAPRHGLFYAGAVARALVVCRDLPADLLLDASHALRRRNDFEHLASALSHPSANASLWREIARYVQPHRDELALVLANVTGARRDREVRGHLARAAAGSAPVFALLCLDAQENTPKYLRRLSETFPLLVPRVLNHPEFEGLSYLDPSDLMVLLDTPQAEVRLAAMTALSRLRINQLQAEEEAASRPRAR